MEKNSAKSAKIFFCSAAKKKRKTKNPIQLQKKKIFKQDLTLAKNKVATYAIEFFMLKFDKNEIYQKSHQTSTFICDLG